MLGCQPGCRAAARKTACQRSACRAPVQLVEKRLNGRSLAASMRHSLQARHIAHQDMNHSLLCLRRVMTAATLLGAITLAPAAHAQTSPLPVSATVERINGRTVESLLRQHAQAGAPTVVFENGARETLDTWEMVLPTIARDATVFAYNRPGYGQSEASASARTGPATVEALRQLLRAKGLKPPYVLVGHSMGGLNTQLFARMYPGEVSGLVLVDSLYPRVIKRPADFPWLTRVAKGVFLSRSVQWEIEQIYDTGEALLALPAVEALRVVQLFNVPKSAGAFAVDFGVVNEDPAVRELVKRLYPQAHKIVLDSDHRIQVDKPDAVIDAIREVASGAAAQPALRP